MTIWKQRRRELCSRCESYYSDHWPHLFGQCLYCKIVIAIIMARIVSVLLKICEKTLWHHPYRMIRVKPITGLITRINSVRYFPTNEIIFWNWFLFPTNFDLFTFVIFMCTQRRKCLTYATYIFSVSFYQPIKRVNIETCGKRLFNSHLVTTITSNAQKYNI